jgi:hypothetical protein
MVYGLSSEVNEPYSLCEAQQSDYWQRAMNTEFDALKRNNTRHLVLLSLDKIL